MLNDTRLKIYINAYITRLEAGESLDDIDNDYISLKRLSEEDVRQIHEKLKI